MPRGEHTGPQGHGPRTGRAAGFCTGNDTPGFETFDRGCGQGRGGGGWGRGGRGWGRGGRWNAHNHPDRVEDLRAISQHLETELQQVKARIAELDKTKD